MTLTPPNMFLKVVVGVCGGAAAVGGSGNAGGGLGGVDIRYCLHICDTHFSKCNRICFCARINKDRPTYYRMSAAKCR